MHKVLVRNWGGGNVDRYVVSTRPDSWDEYERGKWPSVAEFPVSVGMDAETQRRRAYEYCDYMNATIPVQLPIGAKA